VVQLLFAQSDGMLQICPSTSLHWPEPEHVFVPLQLSASCALSTLVQVPRELWSPHDWHDPLHAVSQQ
jgi:hypothetical protein